MDAACFREYARLMHRRSDTLGEDAMMAATARVHGLTVATRNERDCRALRCGRFESLQTESAVVLAPKHPASFSYFPSQK